jgi:transcription antitermination factor NusG
MILEFPAPGPRPPAPAAQLPWFALQIRPQHEFLVARELTKLGIEHYLPTRTRKHWRMTVCETPLIPGYVFAREHAMALYAQLRWTGWLIGILGRRDGAVEIPAEEIETLRMMVSRPKVQILELSDLWHGGEEIEITAGPLTGSTGRVMMVRGKHHLVVSIEMLGRAISAELDAEAVKALGAHAATVDAENKAA